MNINIASLTNQGRRSYMEDEVLYVNKNSYTISAIFDGHGGGDCSKFLKRYFVPLFEYFITNKRYTIKNSLYFTIIIRVCTINWIS